MSIYLNLTTRNNSLDPYTLILKYLLYIYIYIICNMYIVFIIYLVAYLLTYSNTYPAKLMQMYYILCIYLKVVMNTIIYDSVINTLV